MFRMFLFVSCALLITGAVFSQGAPKVDPLTQDVTQGALRVTTKDATVVECPLRHTDVQASVSGFIARVTVTQTFYNPFADKIEAVYVFPLPHTAAIDSMTMVIGDRHIVGIIKRRADARAIYEQALAQGQTASLLEQERPNIFTQSVGNIKPKQEVKIVISYIDTLKYDMGTYEFSFPMVVGPRYNANAPFAGTPAPAGATAPAPAGSMPAEGVNPPILKPGMRTGHDISLSLTLNAGVPVHNLLCPTHQATITPTGVSSATVTLSPADAIPNKDFTLRYSVVGDKPEMAVLANCVESGQGYFMLMMQPKLDEALAKAPPREIVFLIDVSGSMNGQPTAKNVQIMQEFFKRTKADDTIQVITFANETQKLFPAAVPATEENVTKALGFTNGINGGGGTEMMKGINMVLDDPLDPKRTRIVVMLTDGYIGNEQQIIDAVGKKAGDKIKFWTVGIGSAPNKFLLDGVAKQGGGMSAIVELTTDPAPVVEDIVTRIHSAQLAKIKLDWGDGLQVFDVYPRKTPELWAGRPVILFGRYTEGGEGKVTISGTAEGNPLSYSINVILPDGGATANDVLPKVWARNKIEDLMAQDNYNGTPEVTEEVTKTALGYGLMSQYTSFVAVDEQDAKNLSASATPPRRVGIPVPLPEGTNFAGFFGAGGEESVTDALGSVSANQTYYQFAAPSGPAGAAGPAGMRWSGMAHDKQSMSPVRAMHSPMAGKMFAGTVSLKPVTMPTAAPSPMMNTRFSIVAGDGRLAYDDWSKEASLGIADKDVATTSTKRHEEAKSALAEADKLQKAGDLPAAFARAQQAYLLQTAAIAGQREDADGTQANALELLGTLQDATTIAYSAKLPALNDKLKLVIRDQSLEQAIDAVARASGVTIALVPRSLDDAATMENGQLPRVTYLDLRNATVAQALDWLLTPHHLSWAVEKDGIIVGSSRRMAGDSAWTYDVSELIFQKDEKLQGAALQQKLSDTMATVLHLTHFAIGQQGEDGLQPGSAVIFPGARLLVYGNAKTHAQVADLLAALSTPPVPIDINGYGMTVAQWKEVQAFQTESAANAQGYAQYVKAHPTALTNQLLARLDTFSWQLYAGATASKVDLEALTELQLAWKDGLLPDILKGKYAALAYRSSWLIAESAKLLPKDAELSALSASSSQAVATRIIEMAKPLQVTRENYLEMCYALLETRQWLTDPQPALLASVLKPADANLADTTIHTVIASLLAPTADTDKALTKAITDGQIIGNDMMLLTAVAARERGGELWRQFCAQLPDLAKAEQLNGNVLLAANHLVSAPAVMAAK